MSAGFQPIGERARWRVLVDLFCAVPRGELVEFPRIADAIGLDPDRDRKALRAAVRQAGPVLSAEHDRSVIAVRGRGYRVALPDEHVDLAAGQQRRSSRALVRAKRHVDHVDLSGMSEDGRRLVVAAATVLGYQQQQIKRLDLRQSDLESAMRTVMQRTDRTNEEIERIQGQVERMQRQLDESG